MLFHNGYYFNDLPTFLLIFVMTEQEQKEYLKKLGKFVVELRQKKGMKQYELADALDIDVRVMRRIEKGEMNFQILFLFELAFVLDIDASSLIKI